MVKGKFDKTSEYYETDCRLMNEWLHDSPIKGTTFKANLVMSSLLLQKPSQESKSKEHLEALEPRMDLWKSGEIL